MCFYWLLEHCFSCKGLQKSSYLWEKLCYFNLFVHKQTFLLSRTRESNLPMGVPAEISSLVCQHSLCHLVASIIKCFLHLLSLTFWWTNKLPKYIFKQNLVLQLLLFWNLNFFGFLSLEPFGILGIFRFGKPSTKTKLEWNIACILSADLR